MGGLPFDLVGKDETFLLKGFSLQIRLLWDCAAPAARGLGVAVGRGGGDPELRLVCGVAGAELVFDGTENEPGPGVV